MPNDDVMHVDISGNKMPLYVVLSGFATVCAAIIFSTVWLTKLDDRVLTNAEHISETRSVTQQQEKILEQMNVNMSKQTVILDNLIRRVERLEDE